MKLLLVGLNVNIWMRERDGAKVLTSFLETLLRALKEFTVSKRHGPALDSASVAKSEAKLFKTSAICSSTKRPMKVEEM